MSSLKRNVAANAAGRFWIALLTLAAVPVQARILGPESYGLLGFVTAIQMMLTLLDLGLSTTITREVAMDSTTDRMKTKPLLKSLQTFYWGVAILIVVAAAAAAPPLAQHWLKFNELSPASAAAALRTIGIAIALRWPISLYSGILAGIQRMDISNMLEAGGATLRIGGGLVCVLVFRSLDALVSWYVLSAVVEAAFYALITPRFLPGRTLPLGWSLTPLKRVWRFAAGVNLSALLALALTQTDRIVLGKAFSVEALGYYSIAYNTAALLTGVPRILTSALYPSLAEAFSRGDTERIVYRYEMASRYVTWAIAGPAAIMAFFGEDFLRRFISGAAALHASLPLMLLAAGFLCNQALNPCYTLALAAGAPRIPNLTNAMILPAYLPGLYLLTVRFGAVGAAAAWLGLNLLYLFTLLPWVHRRLLGTSAQVYGLRILGVPIACAVVCFGLPKAGLISTGSRSIMLTAAALTVGGIAYGIAFYGLVGAEARRHLLELFHKRHASS